MFFASLTTDRPWSSLFFFFFLLLLFSCFSLHSQTPVVTNSSNYDHNTSSSSSNDTKVIISMSVDQAKKAAAVKAVNDYVKNGMAVGIGSGTTIVYSVKRLAELVHENHWKLRFVPTSYQARQLIKEHSLLLSDLESDPELDVCIDGADEVDQNLVLIKGGGGCLTQEKIVASASKRLVIIADYRKKSKTLGQNWTKGIPIEVIPMSHRVVQMAIEKRFGGHAILRQAVRKMGPVVTDNGNFLLDWQFDTSRTKSEDNEEIDLINSSTTMDTILPTSTANTANWWSKVERDILAMPGVVEIGLFVRMAEHVYFGMQDGTIEELNQSIN